MIDFPAAPNLPLGPNDYAQRYQDQLNNILRLYFNQLSGGLLQIAGTRGGRFLSFPHGAFQHNASAPATLINAPMLVPLSVVDFASGVSLPTSGRMQAADAGIWDLQYSLQFKNTDSQAHNAYLWLRQNGVDLPATTSAFTIPSKHGGGDGYLIGAANFYVGLQADDYVELWWATDSLQVSLDTLPAQIAPYPRPLSPAIVATLSFVSAET